MVDTYGRSCQLGASRRRFEDAKHLHNCQRWTGAIYLGGYAIECSLKALICYEENKLNFKETSVYKKGVQGASLHKLTRLLNESNSLKRSISGDRTGHYKKAWNQITKSWINDELRYSDKQGSQAESEKFIEAVKTMHRLLLNKQGETS